jgi:hypothetical protein
VSKYSVPAFTRFSALALAAFVSATLAITSGCAGVANVAGPTSLGSISGKVHGGQQALVASQVSLYVTSSTATGTAVLTATPGSVASITISQSGGYYQSAPSITFDGISCSTTPAATAVLTNGAVTSATITNPGAGCTQAPVIVFSSPSAATGYGAGAELIGTTFTDNAGGFSFAATPAASASNQGLTSGNCPGGAQAYIIASNGYESGFQSYSNPAVLMMAALGDCRNLSASTTLVVNELTTVAAGYALSSFLTTGGGQYPTAIAGAPVNNSSPSGSATPVSPAGLAHAFINATNLVNTQIGAANTTTTVAAKAGGASYFGGVPAAEINTLANVMAACVNSTSNTSTACTSFFADTPSLTSTTPTNTLQAIVNLARNPASPAAMNTSTGLYSLASAFQVFSAGLTQIPNDWAMAVSYNASTTNAGTSLTIKPYWLALDASDTVYWGGSVATLTGLSAYGLTPATFSAPATGSATRGIAIDQVGNLWLATNNTSVYRYSVASGGAGTAYTVPGSSVGIAIDKANNVWVGSAATTTNVDELAYTGGTTPSWAINYTATAPGGIYGVTVDANQNIWLADYYCAGYTNGPPAVTTCSAGTNTMVSLLPNLNTAAAPTYTTTGTAITPYSATLPNSEARPYGVSMDAGGNAWYTIYGTTTTSPSSSGLVEYAPAGLSATAFPAEVGSFIPATYGTAPDTLGLAIVNLPGIDGAGTLFLPDNTTGSFHMYSTTTGTVLSPTNGIFGCGQTATGTTCGTGSGAAVYNPRAPVIDSTGSVWVGWTNGGVTQMIGIAAPAYPVLAVGRPGVTP